MIDLSLSVFDHVVIAGSTGLFLCAFFFIVPLTADLIWEKVQTKRHIESALKLANINTPNPEGKEK